MNKDSSQNNLEGGEEAYAATHPLTMQMVSAYLSGNPNSDKKESLLPSEYLGATKDLVTNNLAQLAYKALAAKAGDVLKAAGKASKDQPTKLRLVEKTGVPFLSHEELNAKLQLFGKDATDNEAKAYLVREILEYLASKKARSIVGRAFVRSVNKALPKEVVSQAVAKLIKTEEK